MSDSLGNRMKSYENVFDSKIMSRCPSIIRVDGRAFSKLTSKMDKPFDEKFCKIMQSTAKSLIDNIDNAKFCYGQSDEISILLIDYTSLDTQQWFGGRIQKIASIASSLASVYFNKYYEESFEKKEKPSVFDARIFNLNKEEVNNYFLWRQRDCIKNSVSGLAQAHFSHNQLNSKNSKERIDMLNQKGVMWENLSPHLKNGYCIKNDCLDLNIPSFSDNKNYIEELINI